MKVVDGILGLLVVGHGHEAIAFANPLAGLHDDIHLLDSAKRGEELPEGAFSGVVANVVAENCISRLQNINETFGLLLKAVCFKLLNSHDKNTKPQKRM